MNAETFNGAETKWLRELICVYTHSAGDKLPKTCPLSC